MSEQSALDRAREALNDLKMQESHMQVQLSRVLLNQHQMEVQIQQIHRSLQSFSQQVSQKGDNRVVLDTLSLLTKEISEIKSGLDRILTSNSNALEDELNQDRALGHLPPVTPVMREAALSFDTSPTLRGDWTVGSAGRRVSPLENRGQGRVSNTTRPSLFGPASSDEAIGLLFAKQGSLTDRNSPEVLSQEGDGPATSLKSPNIEHAGRQQLQELSGRPKRTLIDVIPTSETPPSDMVVSPLKRTKFGHGAFTIAASSIENSVRSESPESMAGVLANHEPGSARAIQKDLHHFFPLQARSDISQPPTPTVIKRYDPVVEIINYGGGMRKDPSLAGDRNNNIRTSEMGNGSQLLHSPPARLMTSPLVPGENNTKQNCEDSSNNATKPIESTSNDVFDKVRNEVLKIWSSEGEKFLELFPYINSATSMARIRAAAKKNPNLEEFKPYLNAAILARLDVPAKRHQYRVLAVDFDSAKDKKVAKLADDADPARWERYKLTKCRGLLIPRALAPQFNTGLTSTTITAGAKGGKSLPTKPKPKSPMKGLQQKTATATQNAASKGSESTTSQVYIIQDGDTHPTAGALETAQLAI